MVPMRSVPHRVVCLLGPGGRDLPADPNGRQRRRPCPRPGDRRAGRAQSRPVAAARRRDGHQREARPGLYRRQPRDRPGASALVPRRYRHWDPRASPGRPSVTPATAATPFDAYRRWRRQRQPATAWRAFAIPRRRTGLARSAGAGARVVRGPVRRARRESPTPDGGSDRSRAPAGVKLPDEGGDAGHVRRRHRRPADPHPAVAVGVLDAAAGGGEGLPLPVSSVLDQPARMRPNVDARRLGGVAARSRHVDRADRRWSSWPASCHAGGGHGDDAGELGRRDPAVVADLALDGGVRRPVRADLVDRPGGRGRGPRCRPRRR